MRSLPALLATLAMPLLPAALPAQSCTQAAAPVALVLSGGGAKGIAHIGVLRVLDSLGVRPDIVVGTSMGAVIGGMYASGYAGRELDSLARALPLASLFRTYAPRAPGALDSLPALVVWEQESHSFALQSAAIRPPEANSLIDAAMLRGNLIARGDFDRLPIPFRAVATDLRDRSPVVLAGGDLARAVRASLAIPLIFPPESIGASILADGGLSANVPVSIARHAGAVRVIVSDATERPSDSLDYFSPLALADRLLGFLFEQPADSLRPGDIRIRPEVDGFTSLDFSSERVARLIELGETAARAALDGAPCLPRGRARSPVLPSVIGAVRTPGLTPAERRGLLERLGLGGGTLDVKRLHAGVRSLAFSDALDAVWLNPSGTGDTVSFELAVRRSPRRAAALGLAYDNELGGRVWAGARDRTVLGGAVDAAAIFALGELRRELSASLRRGSGWSPWRLPVLGAQAATESVRRVDAGRHEIAAAHTAEARGVLGVERVLGDGWVMGGGASVLFWREPGIPADHAAGGRLELRRDDRAGTPILRGDFELTPTVRRAALAGAPLLRVARIGVQPLFRLGWGERLPLAATFPLGGTDGFPGLHLGELRGTREAMGGLVITVPVAGPVVLVGEGAVGRVATGGALLAHDGWIGGGRLGLGADTPIGPIRVDYGIATGGRDALRVRLGRWF
jgi:NTE family protein